MNTSEIYNLAFAQPTCPDFWQQQFATDEWPEVLIAPTGSGKTAGVTLGWAAHRLRTPETTPRRLVWCLPMRTLVEQTARAAKEWFGRLNSHGVEEGLLPGPRDIHVLMGGVEAARWLDSPNRPAVIVGTQDMLLSRALMRGYASSRAIWPMEFALLHQDAQWVFDEVQLMGAGRATSAQLEAFRRRDASEMAQKGRTRPNSARSLWISATLEPDWLRTVDFRTPAADAVRRVDPQQERDERLRRLTTAKKVLTRTPIAPKASKAADVEAYVAQLARSVLDAHRSGRMTLVILNRVQRAQDLHATLAKEMKNTATPPTLALVHGRFRPADRRREFEKVVGRNGRGGAKDVIVVATQAVEAGVDFSAAVLFSELAPWPSMVQRFGRANRHAELEDGADVRWIDLLAKAEDAKTVEALSLPYSASDMEVARERLRTLTDVAPAKLPPAGDIEPPRRVIRRKDLDDLFDTDSDLTGFDVDISPYVRDAEDADLRVFWRDLSSIGDKPPHPRAEELCAVPIGAARDWLKKVRKRHSPIFVRDPQWRRTDAPIGAAPPGWTRLAQDPWPGLTLLADVTAGGYCETSGFTGNPKHIPRPIVDNGEPLDGSTESPHARHAEAGGETEAHDEDPRSEIGVQVLLSAHLRHVEAEAEALCNALEVDTDTRAAVIRAARWHDVGKVHDVFQDTMRRGLGDGEVVSEAPLAKTVKPNLRHGRAYFRHELASALALLAQEHWSRDADLAAYLVAAHHGKVRMNLRALPRERAPTDTDRADARFARGIWEGDVLKPVALGGGERWPGGRLVLSVMELGWEETTRESWTERTRDLLTRFGPFRLAWMETLVRLADWRASAKERERGYGDA
ncbi:MAG: CRISPR-associated endonuclease Cas3'' [Gammaproteobacteria bacterium]|nr:CRISPR-associated endonuclease Cas3'' [Gammaproteobacteria bacterium]